MSELGLFLRSRRDAVTPADVGLPGGSRRRAPGLRRAELAALAGVSVEYLQRLEQGRDRHPSAQVLTALADALRLSTAERAHLHRLAKGADPAFTCRPPEPPTRELRATVRALLERLDPDPAALLGPAGDVVAHTDGFGRLFGPLGLFDGPAPNLARFVFVDQRARQAFLDWEQVADEQVAALKQGPFRAHPAVAAVADDLAGEPAFTDRVARLPGLPAAHGLLRMVHPLAGALRLQYETLELPPGDELRLVAWLPADAATAVALERLRPPLRLVAG